MTSGRLNNNREWHAAYTQGRDAGLESTLEFDYPPNMEVNQQGSRSTKLYVQRPTRWHDVANLTVPALFVYGDGDIRPSWPVEQVAHLMLTARFALLRGANHYLWHSHEAELSTLLHSFLIELSL